MCAPKAPKPDPAIGEAAKSNAEIAKRQLTLGESQLEWEKARATRQDPLAEKIVQQQIDSGDKNTERADEQWQIYKDLFHPVEQQMVKDATEFDSPERQERMAAEAGADVSRGYTAARDQNTRAMEAMGINPNSGRFAGLTRETGLGLAKDSAGAMNQARRATEQQGIALRTGVAQFGRNMPSTGIAADTMALNAGNAATGTMAQGSAIRNANQAAASQWFGGAANSNTQAGGLLNNLYQNQIAGQSAAAQQSAGMMQGIGTLAMAGAM